MEESLARVIAEHREIVAAWMHDEPGAWGKLAGQAVLAERRRLGRPLTERERRVVWQALWDTLVALRARGGLPE